LTTFNDFSPFQSETISAHPAKIYYLTGVAAVPDKVTLHHSLWQHFLRISADKCVTITWTAFSDYNSTGLTLLNGFSFLVIFLLFWGRAVDQAGLIASFRA